MANPSSVDDPSVALTGARPTLGPELTGLLSAALTPLAPPPVRALHLPPSPWTGHRDAEFAVIELADGTLGLAYALLGDTLAELTARASGWALAGADPLALARWWHEAADARRVVGFAAVNALTRWLFDRAGFVPPAATDSIAGLAPAAGEHIGMVGRFPPLIRQVTRTGARLTVLELRADLAGDHGDHRVVLDPAALAGCDKILATSTMLLNDTLENVLALTRGARRFALIGPGASCLPDPLFARGVTLMGGVWIDDAPSLLEATAAGTGWGPAAHKTALAPADYPGLAELAARAG